MTISGSTGSGGLGGSIQPSVNEQEQTAATKVLKESMGLSLMQDTLDAPFTQLGGQIGRYPANPSRPTLPPLISTRGPAAFEAETSTNWKDAYKALANSLPEDVKRLYFQQMSLPIETRNINFTVLDNLLVRTATALSWIQDANSPSKAEGIAAAGKTLNQALPYVQLTALTTMATMTLQGASNYLDLVGANDPQHDALRNYVRLTGNGLDELLAFQSQIGSAQSITGEDLQTLASKLSDITAQYYQVSTGDDLSILGITLSAMTTLTAALAFGETGSPSFYLALSLGTMGMDTASSQAGFLGEAATLATLGMANSLALLGIGKANYSGQTMLQMITSALFFSAAAFATLVHEVGIGPLSGETQADIDSAKTNTFALAISLLVESKALAALCEVLTDTLGAAPAQQKYINQALELAALTTMLLTSAPKGNSQGAAALFDSLEGTYQQSLSSLAELLSEGLLNQTWEGEQAIRLGISLQEAKTAVDEGNFEDLIAALLSPLATLGAKEENFMGDIAQLKASIHTLAESLTTGLNDKTNTNTAVSIAV